MNNENVIALPASTAFSPEQALLSALEFTRTDNITDVLVIGYDNDGVMIIRSSRMSRADALFMLEKAKQWVLT